MCGIAGVWHKNGALEVQGFERALNLMQHRGPDDKVSMRTDKINLGTQRLRIIGTSSGKQPVYDERGNYLAFNGAIYNYLELADTLKKRTDSDTEILFELLVQNGSDAIAELRGMFAFAYYNEPSDTFLLARDRVGQKPLYYFANDETMLFASELKTLVCLMREMSISVEINEESIYHFLCLSNIPEPETIYKNVYAVKPGHLLTFKQGDLKEECYWNYQYLPKWQLPKNEIFDRTQQLITEATKLRLRADVPVGLFLSGGWDSSVIAYEAAKLNPDLQTYTVEYPFQTTQNETEIARNTAKYLGLSHQVIPMEGNPTDWLQKVVKTFDQPFADSSAIPNLAIAEAAGKHVKVMLNGDGGDEQFGGYRRYFLAKNETKLLNFKYLNKLLPSGERRSNIGYLKRIANILRLPKEEKYLAYTVDMLRDGDRNKIWKEATSNSVNNLLRQHAIEDLSPLDQLMHHDRKFNLLSGILVKMDRASMAYSVEARSPFLDHELFEFTSRLPDEYKVSGLNRKVLLKSIYKDKLPQSVVQGKKISFEAPLEYWLKHDFQPLIKELLYNPGAKIYHYLNKEVVFQLLDKHQFRDRNVAYIIYSLLILELWLQQYEVEFSN
jgi:asparagine synthase (glutamine-hydrolysing)